MADKSPYNGAVQDIYPLIYQSGVTTLNKGRANINSPQAVKAVQFYVDLVNKDKVCAPGTLTNMESDKVEAFGSGQVAFMVENVAFLSTLKQNAKLHFSIAPLPRGVTTGSRLTGWNLGLSAQSTHKAEAWRFMQWLTSPKGDGMVAAAAEQLPGNTAAPVPAMQTDPLLKTAAAALKDPRVMAEDAVTPQFTDLQRILVEQVQAALQGQKSVQQAMDDAAAGWNAILDKYR
jgi:multiple sugar transport system substrate-binding protein